MEIREREVEREWGKDINHNSAGNGRIFQDIEDSSWRSFSLVPLGIRYFILPANDIRQRALSLSSWHSCYGEEKRNKLESKESKIMTKRRILTFSLLSSFPGRNPCVLMFLGMLDLLSLFWFYKCWTIFSFLRPTGQYSKYACVYWIANTRINLLFLSFPLSLPLIIFLDL